MFGYHLERSERGVALARVAARVPLEVYVFYRFALLFFVAQAVGRAEPPRTSE